MLLWTKICEIDCRCCSGHFLMKQTCNCRTKFLQSNPRWNLPVNSLLCLLAFGGALPAAIALFPQESKVYVLLRTKVSSTSMLISLRSATHSGVNVSICKIFWWLPPLMIGYRTWPQENERLSSKQTACIFCISENFWWPRRIFCRYVLMSQSSVFAH